MIVPHRALVNLLTSMREPGIEAADSLLAVTTLRLDIAALELFVLTDGVGAHARSVFRRAAKPPKDERV